MHGQVESNAYGFDLLALQAIPPTNACDTGHTHDFMSYGCSPWVSLYTWQAIASWLGSSPALAESQPASDLLVAAVPKRAALATDSLLVSGTVSPDGSITMTAPLLVEAPPADSGGSGAYTIELLDASATAVFALAFEPETLLHAPAGTGEFTLLLPRLPGVVRIRLLRGDASLVELAAGPSLAAPSFRPDSIPSEAPATGEATIAWAPGADGLTYALEVGPDADGLWATLGITDSSSLTIDLPSLPQDCSCRFRLQASDGVNVAVTESKTFHTSPRAPQPAILSPAPGYLRPGLPVRLTGTLFGEAAADASLEWLVDDAVVASGAAADIQPLPDGRHHIVFRVRQSGLSAEAAIDVDVAADTDGDGLPDEWERKYGLNPADPEDAALDSDGDNLLNWQELAFGTEPDNLDSDGDNYSDYIEIAGGGDPNYANSLPHAIHAWKESRYRNWVRSIGPSPPGGGSTYWLVLVSPARFSGGNRAARPTVPLSDAVVEPVDDPDNPDES